MHRRTMIKALAAAGAVAPPHLARAQSWPNRPIRLIDAYPPGGSTDTILRLIAPHLQNALGQPVLVENRPGASGNIGAQACASAAPDGHTFLLASNSMLTANPHLFDKARVDPFTDLALISPVANIGIVLVTQANSPWTDFREFLAQVKRDTGKLAFGSPGVGTPMHLIGEMIKESGNANMLHVPYKGGAPLVTDVVAGHVPVGLVAHSVVAGFIEQGRLRALAAGGSTRLAALPNVPVVAEVIPGADLGAWCGLVAPPKTPAQFCERMALEITTAMQRSDVVSKLRPLGLDRIAGNANAFTGMVKSEYARVGALIKHLGISLTI